MHSPLFRLIPYRLSLTRPFTWRGGEVTEREGVLLRLEDAAGRVGWGDASPLPGFSRETVDEAGDSLEAAGQSLSEIATGSLPQAPAAIDALTLTPSARYAADLALLDLAARRDGVAPARLLHASAADRVSVAALIDAPPERVVDEAGRRAGEGYRAVKLKAGRLDPESDAEIARDVRRRVGADTELRVDVNRAWTPDQAATFARLAGPAHVAYVEEPLAAAYRSDLRAFASETDLPIALDETLSEDGADLIGPWVAAVVLKPTVLGGIAAVLRLADKARAAGTRVVLSAAFESGVGQRGVALLAAATGAQPAGLDPYARLAADVFDPRLPLDTPEVSVETLFSAVHRVVDVIPAED
jgi:O-succinylbenzoate synthase